MNRLRERFLPLLKAEYFSYIDFHFAEEVILREKREDELLYLTALSVSRCAREKHVCLDMHHVPAGEYPEGDTFEGLVSFPEPGLWKERLLGCSSVGSPGADAPLILDGERVYLHKYHRYETGLADAILSRARILPFDSSMLSSGLELLFDRADGIDWQRCAAMNAVIRNFSVVTGGPGTGKTTTAAKIVLLLLRQAKASSAPCRIALCAPTGKAAAHLHASIRKAVDRIAADGTAGTKGLVAAIEDDLPDRSHTIHRLLGAIPGSPRFRHDRDNPLPYDVVIVDEVSMSDVALSAKLVDAVPPGSRLIFLGDMDQLSSVEAGAVLGDICTPHGAPYDGTFASNAKIFSGADLPPEMISSSEGGIRGSIVYLTESRRFDPASPIGKMARLVNEGRGADARAAAATGTALVWREYATSPSSPAERHSRECSDIIAEFSGIDSPGSPLYKWSEKGSHEEFFFALSQFQILCALRNGVYGSVQCAASVVELLEKRGYLSGGKGFRHGQTVMITRNDHALGLYNGDIGVICRNDAGLLRAYFRNHETGAYRSFSPYQLPPHESSLALTVHKSQGSEYEKVLLILPGTDSPVVTRELVYTGITRVKKACAISGRSAVFDAAVGRRIERASALGERLWG